MRHSPALLVLTIALGCRCEAQVFTVLPIPLTKGQPGGVTTGYDGNLWFTTGEGNSIASLSVGGVFTEYPLRRPGSWPHGIRKGPKRSMWFVTTYGIGRIDMDGSITEFSLPICGAGAGFITASPDGALLVSGGISGGGAFLAQVTEDGEFRIRTWPTWEQISSHAIDSEGTVWLARPLESLLSQLKPSGEVCDIPFYRAYTVHPRSPTGVYVIPVDVDAVMYGDASGNFQTRTVDGAPEGLAEDAAGNLWITAFVQNALVVISASGQQRSFKLPTPRALARTVTIGPDGAVWLLGARPPSAYRFQPPPDIPH